VKGGGTVGEFQAGHSPLDAVTWGNRIGWFLGARLPALNKWMNDPNSYKLQLGSQNMRTGGKLAETYLSTSLKLPVVQ